MKFVYSEIDHTFDTDVDGVNTLVIENQDLFYKICNDIYNQINGLDGASIVSIDNKPVDISKNVELLNQFIPFQMNKKELVNKLVSSAQKLAVSADYYEDTMNLLATIERYLLDLSDAQQGNINYSKINIESILKAVGMEFTDDYDSLGEKIIDYMELIREYDKEKLFVFVNLRSYIDDDKMTSLFDSLKRRQFSIIMIENKEYKLLPNEIRYIVDEELCEID